MTLFRWLRHALRGAPAPSPVSAANAIAGYVALSRLPGFAGTLDERVVRLAGLFAAELGGCRWCIEHSAHEARLAGLSPELLGRLGAYSRSALLDERDQAALAVVEAVAGGHMRECGEPALQRARRFFTEHQLAELTAIAAERHCVDSLNLNHL